MKKVELHLRYRNLLKLCRVRTYQESACAECVKTFFGQVVPMPKPARNSTLRRCKCGGYVNYGKKKVIPKRAVICITALRKTKKHKIIAFLLLKVVVLFSFADSSLKSFCNCNFIYIHSTLLSTFQNYAKSFNKNLPQM
jgi:hypothetical protein